MNKKYNVCKYICNYIYSSFRPTRTTPAYVDRPVVPDLTVPKNIRDREIPTFRSATPHPAATQSTK